MNTGWSLNEVLNLPATRVISYLNKLEEKQHG